MALALRRMFRNDGPMRRRPWISTDEIVTGERLQGLAGITLVPSHVAEFHRDVRRHAGELVIFDRYEDLGASELARLSSKSSLFVYTHELPGFLEAVWPRLEGEGYVLITHNSDAEIGDSYLEWLDASGPKLLRWFAQNATVHHPKLEPLPIGIANRMWTHGSPRVLHRVIGRRAGTPKRRLLAALFDPGSHPSRPEVVRVLSDAFPDLLTGAPRTKSYRRFLEMLAAHRFCACPRGNGIDTHRVWECLYLDVVPILERSSHTEQWQDRGLPVLLVDDWSEVTPAILNRQAQVANAFSPHVRELLRMSYYARLVATAEALSADSTRPAPLASRRSDREP